MEDNWAKELWMKNSSETRWGRLIGINEDKDNQDMSELWEKDVPYGFISYTKRNTFIPAYPLKQTDMKDPKPINLSAYKAGDEEGVYTGPDSAKAITVGEYVFGPHAADLAVTPRVYDLPHKSYPSCKPYLRFEVYPNGSRNSVEIRRGLGIPLIYGTGGQVTNWEEKEIEKFFNDPIVYGRFK